MEEKTTELRPDDIDDNMVSSSPDSGLDLKSADSSPKKASLLDPHLYNRRLTLLKSLSQDSEYSLDTSLFDAEEFLQDMGFAGSRDPTIPDRFLPSLMQRLSRFPESEMESLHDRIIQSIGCFRRKEGKRRLFRNLSMGKDPRRRHFLGCPSNCHPLLRSNTDPSTFPYEETSSTASSSSLLQSGRLSSNDSGRLSSNDSRLHSLGSSKDDCEFPESPIAILVSAASVDQDQQAASEDQDTSPTETVSGLAGASSQADRDEDAEFVSTVERIQKLADGISVQEDDDVSQIDDDVFQIDDDVSQLDDNVSQLDYNVPLHEGDISQADGECDSNGLLIEIEQETPYSEDSHFSEIKPVGLPNESNSTISETDVPHNFNSLNFINPTILDRDLESVRNINGNVSESQESNGKSLNSKTPLRRTSNAHFYKPKSLRTFENVQYQKSTDDGDSANAVKETSGIENEGQYSMENGGSNLKLDELETALNKATIFNEDAVLINATEPGCLQNDYSTNTLPFQNMPHNNGNKFSKPKYSRADSLTNFLSSMLDTSDVAGARPSIPTSNPFSENKCNNDSEMPGSFASSQFVSFGASDAKSKSLSSEGTKKISSTFVPVKCSKIKESIDNAPNRKRRALRRMSSSLQCCDDVNCNDSNGLKVDSLRDDVHKSATTFLPETSSIPKINHGSFKSVSSSHRVIHSCRSLPVNNLCITCNAHCENDDINKNVIDCQTQISRNCRDCDARRKRNTSYFKKCKRKRNLSCPALEISLNHHSTRFKPKTVQCDCMVNKHMQHFTENNQHKSVVLPCNLSQKEAWDSCSCCFNENLNYRLNLCCAASPSNIIHSPNIENCDSNVRCLGPPSPSLLQPSNDTFAFGPSLWKQNRYLCYSSPDLRHECCTNQLEHCRQRSFTNVDECAFNSFDKCGPQSFKRDNHFTDDVFPHRCCSFRYNQCSDFDQDTKKTRMSVRTPQRQNSISIADSEIPTQNSTTNSNNVPVPFSSNKDDVVKEPLTAPTITNVGIALANTNDDSPTLNVPKVSHLSEAPFNILTPDNNPNLILSKLKTEETNQIPPPKPPSSPTTKSEALLERKIRIFSKFLANLGNLSKSVPDTDVDNKHKRITRDQKSTDVPISDKKAKSRAFKVSCPAIQSGKHSASQPQFDKLLSLLKSMDLSNKNLDKIKVLNENSEVSGQCEEKLQENKSPVYKNKVLLQANANVGEGQHRSYKPVLYSSTVSLYINAEDKMDTQIDRFEKADSSPGGDQKKREAPEKTELTHNRSSPQMSFRGVSKEIEDLQLSIQKAKEMRMCASKELHLLQELLSMDENTTKEKKSTGVDSNRCEQEAVARSTDVKPNKALADLREKSKKEVLEDTSFWQEEIQKVKEETKQAWQAKLERMEARLLSQEEELRRLQSDNEALHRHALDSSPSCQHCRTTENNGRTDSAFEDDEEYTNHKAPSIPIQSTRQECERLQQRLMEEEQRADQLNLMLNQKLIEINKIQITLSKQTKEMIELEKSYLQLQCRLRRGTSKPVVSRLCSRSSPFSPKNLCPKPSPPASPQPANGMT